MPAPVALTPPASIFPKDEALSERQYRERQHSQLHHSSIPLHHGDHLITPKNAHPQQPVFLTESEYRSYGLQSGRHLLPTAASNSVPIGHEFDNYGAEQLRSNLTPSDVNTTMVQNKGAVPDLLFLSEKEYRTYGLKGNHESHYRINPTREANCSFDDPSKDVCNPYDDSTASLVNRYLSLPRTAPNPAESYYITGARTYTNSSSYIQDRRDHLEKVNPDGRRPPYASHASDSVLDYNQKYHRLGDEPSFSATTVSSRYTFTGPSVFRH